MGACASTPSAWEGPEPGPCPGSTEGPPKAEGGAEPCPWDGPQQLQAHQNKPASEPERWLGLHTGLFAADDPGGVEEERCPSGPPSVTCAGDTGTTVTDSGSFAVVPRHPSFPTACGTSARVSLSSQDRWAATCSAPTCCPSASAAPPPPAAYSQSGGGAGCCCDSRPVTELVVDGSAVLSGAGGPSACYSGRWHNTPVAIKIMATHNSEVEAATHALEMAVMTSVTHPAIVAGFACLTDMVELAPSGPISEASLATSVLSVLSTSPGAGKRYRRLAPGEVPPPWAPPPVNILVTELCDGGPLGAALDGGAFADADGPGGVAVAPVVEVLLDVASALKYLHSMRLVHGRLSLESVLLKRDPSRRAGFAAKLGDFSRCSLLDESGRALGLTSRFSAGAAAAAPSLGPVGSGSWADAARARAPTGPEVDVAAFGVLIREVFARGAAARGLTTATTGVFEVRPAARRRAGPERLGRGRAGGAFGAGFGADAAAPSDACDPAPASAAPAPYAALAAACCAADPRQRPSAGELAERLEHLAATEELLASLAG